MDTSSAGDAPASMGGAGAIPGRNPAMNAVKLFAVTLFSVLAVACGGNVEELGTDPSQETPADQVPVSNEDLGQTEQQVWCGGGGPPYSCLVRCCSHANWTDLGVPEWGQCTQMGNDYCQWRGGNCGSCWGYL
ncbi:hypothetical protein [Pyxidicoccus xibeiensis]|uniref:hypothetical protein n=1 Tax=Pyxidicoccus xibeiensis TaxID=2906759 RepID=UPI0020A833B4|nr:hypothetical protein [Pyxidicoccus xibeiensis]MCP3135841.1 hypothetical protein [Pyxidicoccus xibeiensis]